MIVVEPKRSLMPTIARYPAMPADRYWDFEDGLINLTDRMFLCPAVSALQGAPLEHVMVMRRDGEHRVGYRKARAG